MSAPHVLLIEDEAPMRQLLRITLKQQGFRLTESATGIDGTRLTEQLRPDLVLLDLGLPDLGGLEVTHLIRRKSDVPIVVISARDAEEQKVQVLDAGADDYVTKPFLQRELLARLRVALRRRPAAKAEEAREPFRVGELEIDFDGRQVRRAGRAWHITPKEHELLRVLAAFAGRVVPHERLLSEVWGPSAVEQVHYLRVFMKQLRRKLEPDPEEPRYLITEPGIGYRLRAKDR